MPSVRKIVLEILAKDRASKVLAKIGKGLKMAGIAMAGAATAAGVAAIKLGVESVRVATDFETSMARLSIAAKGSGESLGGMRKAALKVGADTRLLGVSASGAAESMTGLYKAGLTTTEIFGDMGKYMAGTAELGGALRAAIDLAAATELDMVQASDLAAITLATFGGELKTEAERADFITKAMDNFVKTADASVAEVGDLAAALANIGPTAAAFGFSMEDTNNALAILSTRGIRGAEAGTALKSMLTNMMRQTKKSKEALALLNIELYDEEHRLKSLPKLVGDFEKAMSGLTEEERNQYVQMIAGTYGMKAMQTLLAEGTDGWDAMAKATDKATGIQDQAATMADTLAGQWEALQGVWETAQIQIGTALVPSLRNIIATLTDLWEKHGPKVIAFVEQIGKVFEMFTKYIAFAVAEGDPLNDWLTHLPEAIQPVAEAIGNLLTGETKMDLAGMFDQLVKSAGAFLELITPERIAQAAEAIETLAGIIEKVAPIVETVGTLILGSEKTESKFTEAVTPKVEEAVTGVFGGKVGGAFSKLMETGLGKSLLFAGTPLGAKFGQQAGGWMAPKEERWKEVKVTVSVDNSGALQAYVANEMGSHDQEVASMLYGGGGPTSQSWWH